MNIKTVKPLHLVGGKTDDIPLSILQLQRYSMTKSMLVSTGIVLLVVLLTLEPVLAYEFRIYWPQEKVTLDEIRGAHELTTDGNLHSRILMDFGVAKNFTGQYTNLTIHFNPWEFMHQPPVVNVTIELCDKAMSFGWNGDTGFSGT